MIGGQNVGAINVKIGADASNLQRNFKKASREIQQGSKKIEGSFSGLTRTLAGASGIIAGAFAVDAIRDFGKAVVDTRAQFQKFEAVLKNTLGSNSQAQRALQQIQGYAATTNYQVDQITDSFIKLSNRGVVPTQKDLEKIGDLANALGKDFGQLTEAILDVNNPERWAELGVKVKTVGDTIQGTFRGVTVTAERTEEGALDLAKAFAELDGVAGTTSAIAGTLGGQLSNLEDNFTSLRNEVGKLIESDATGFFSALNRLVSDITGGLSKINDPAGQLLEYDNYTKARENLVALRIEYSKNEKDAQKLLNTLGYIPEIYKSSLKTLSEAMQRQGEIIKDIEKASSNQVFETKSATVSLESLRQKLADLEKQRLKAPIEDIQKYTKEIIALESRIENLVNPKVNISIPTLQSKGFSDITAGSLDFSIPDNTIETIDSLKNSFDDLGGILQDIKLNFDEIGYAMGVSLSQGANAMSAFKSVAVKEMSEVLQAIIKVLLAKMGLALGPAGLLAGGLAGLFAGKIASIFNKIPGLATGGLVTSPGVFQIAEGGEPEAVIPLSKLEKMVGAGGVEVFGRISGTDIMLMSNRVGSANSKRF